MGSSPAEVRQALSHSAAAIPISLGRLYDARSEQILFPTILKTSPLPPSCVTSVERPGLTYKYTAGDSFEEKFSSLNISAELGMIALCGMLGTGSWCLDYLSNTAKKTYACHASTVCVVSTKNESLRLESAELRDLVDFSVLNEKNATHVVCSIDWGARTLVTMKQANTEYDNKGATRGGNSKGQETKENSQSLSQSWMGKIAKCVGNLHVAGGVEWDSTVDSFSTAIEFDVATDVSTTSYDIPTNFEQVRTFLKGVRSSIRNVNDGKGVVISFHILPIRQLAQIFGAEMQHETIVRKIDQWGIDESISILQELDESIKQLQEYVDSAIQHSFCVPETHIKKAKRTLTAARSRALGLKSCLKDMIVNIRDGSAEMQDLQELLLEYSTFRGTEKSSYYILGEYSKKMAFADSVKDAGADYLSYKQLQDNMIRKANETMYILHFSQVAQKQSGWDEERKTVFELLQTRSDQSQYRVAVVDYDAPSSEKDLRNAYIQRCYDGNVIVPDVTQDLKDLAELCQLKCDDGAKLTHVSNHSLPCDRRVIRVPCPGKGCLPARKRGWICPTCRTPVSYGLYDNLLYCQCPPYHFSHALFRCNKTCHGRTFKKYDNQHLQSLLKVLEKTEECNILLLGRSGVGKSTFINAFANYMNFPSLQDAIDDAVPLRYVIPGSFTCVDENKQSHEVVIGSETLYEKYSRVGNSSTRRAITYCFNIKGLNFRFIDTPGICDTGGVHQDEKNAKDILRMLEMVDKISGILILMRPDEVRLDATLQFCLGQLLTRLHRDASKNILFGFTSASTTHFCPGSTASLLDTSLRKFETDISRCDANQFCFESNPFRYLAARKICQANLVGGFQEHANAWECSVKEVERLIETVLELPAHNVSKTLQLNRAAELLEAMAKPLATFTTTARTTQTNLQEYEKELLRAVAHGGDLAKKAERNRAFVDVPIRHNLDKKRTVCCHPDCTSQVLDEGSVKRTIFNTVCHDDCHARVADEVKGATGLEHCRPFRGWFSIGNDCAECTHTWKEHMRISYEFQIVKRPIDDETVLSDIQSNEEIMNNLKVKISAAQEYQKLLAEEQEQIRSARAIFFIYLSNNTIGSLRSHSDATLQYLDLHIAVASRDGRETQLKDLISQRTEHTEAVKALQDAIAVGNTSSPDEAGVKEVIDGLQRMQILGKDLNNALDHGESVHEEIPRFIFVNMEAKDNKGKKSYWYNWRNRFGM